MSTQNIGRLEEIHSMLSAGHRCVRLEKHTFLLWGIVGGILCGGTESVINNDIFPDFRQQALVLISWLSFWLLALGLLDYFLTKRAKRGRDETLSFAQAQMTRAWWMLLCIGALASFSMYFYGGGAMMYVLWIVILGLGLYLFGLFSKFLIEWVGLAMIVLGIIGPAAGLSYEMTRWLAASCFAIGLPLAGWMASRVDDQRIVPRCLALCLWSVIVVGIPALLTSTLLATVTPASHSTQLANFHPIEGEQVVSLPVGTPVLLRLSLDSPVLTLQVEKPLQMTLTRSIDIALQNGKPEGRYRFEGDRWASIRDGLLMLQLDRVQPVIKNRTAVLYAHLTFKIHNHQNSVK